MPHYHFRELVADGIDRVKSRCRVLGNVRDFLASNMLHFEFYCSADSLSGSRNNSHYRLCRDSLARSGLSNETNRLALLHLKVDTINCFHHSRKCVEVGSEPVNM